METDGGEGRGEKEVEPSLAHHLQAWPVLLHSD